MLNLWNDRALNQKSSTFSDVQFSDVQFNAWLTWMEIKLFNHAALLNFPNFIAVNRSNYYGQINHFMGIVTLKEMCQPI